MAEVEIRCPSTGTRLPALVRLAEFLVERLGEGGGRLGQRHAVLRPLRAGERRLDRAEIELERVGEDRVGRVGCRATGPAPWRRPRPARRAPSCAPVALQIGERLRVDREEAAGRAIFRRHVGDGGAVRERQIGEAGAVEFDELADHALLAQHLGDGQHEIGGGDAFAQLAGQLEADDFGDQHGDRLAEHGRFRLDAADAPAQHREAVDHGGVAVGADQRVGIGDRVAAIRLSCVHTVWARYSRLTWWQMPVPGGTTRKLSKAPLAPAQERVALAVALIFDGRRSPGRPWPCRSCRPSPNGR